VLRACANGLVNGDLQGGNAGAQLREHRARRLLAATRHVVYTASSRLPSGSHSDTQLTQLICLTLISCRAIWAIPAIMTAPVPERLRRDRWGG